MDGAATNDGDQVALHRGRKHAMAKSRAIPPLYRLIVESDVQNPFLDFLMPGHRLGNGAGFTSAFNDLLRSSHSLGFTESTLIQVDDYSLPPLHWSAVMGCSIAVQELLNNGYNPLLKLEDSGHTVLHSVALYGPLARWHVNDTERLFGKIVPLLSRALSVQDNQHATPFHLLSMRVSGDTRVKFYEALLRVFLRQLESQRDRAQEILNVQDHRGNTMLHYLAEGATVAESVLLELLPYGISVSIQNKEGQTAYDVATKSGNKLIAEIFNPQLSDTMAAYASKKKAASMQVNPLHEIAVKQDKGTRARRKPTRYDPTFHDEVPKFLQQEGTIKKKRKKHCEPGPDDGTDGRDAAKPLEDSVPELANSKLANSKERFLTASLSLRPVKNTGVTTEQPELPPQSSGAAETSSHIGTSQQQLLPLLESLVACGLWEQLTDVATRMKRELEQEKAGCQRKLEVSAGSFEKVKGNLLRCGGEMERLRKEMTSLRRTEGHLNEQIRVTVDRIREIDDKICKLDCFVKKATADNSKP